MISTLLDQRYTLHEKIGEGSTGIVYAATDMVEGRRVAIKIFAGAIGSRRPEDLIRLKHEILTVAALHHPHIAAVYGILQSGNERAVVMEFIEGRPLSELMPDGSYQLPMEHRIAVVRQVADALDHAHRAGVIHRDLSPHNIIIRAREDAESGVPHAMLVDFGCALIKTYPAPRDAYLRAAGQSPSVNSDPFTYMPPEQIQGGRRIDGRSDLYSLGVVLYEIITGRPPFIVPDAHSIMHQHLTKLPEPPSLYRPGLCPAIDRIVLKLLAKDPEQRYQSARGLCADLDRLAGGEDDFLPGLRDPITRLSYETELVGRASEFETLSGMVNESVNGTGMVCIIGGDAGIGKTRLAADLRLSLHNQGRLVLYGKCFDGEGKAPYSPFCVAIDEYLRQFALYSESKKQSVISAIAKSAEVRAGLLPILNPNLRHLFPDLPPLAPLEGDREKRRFLLTAASFFLTLAKSDQGLVLVLDDLQWADEGTIALLHEITVDIEQYPLFVIGTCRETELPYGHALKKFVIAAKEKRLPVRKITLAPFALEQTALMAGRLLRRPVDDPAVRELAELVQAKSCGNPFFIREIVKHLVDERVISFSAQGLLEIDDRSLSDLILPDTIIETLVRRISRLDSEACALLSYAAIAGKRFELPLLFALFPETDANSSGGLAAEDIVQIVDQALALHLLEEDPHHKNMLTFTHDTIREAFVRTIPADTRRSLHAKIADALEKLYLPNADLDAGPGAVLFDLAHHAIEAGDREKILRYCERAGLLAQIHFSHDDAIVFLSWAMMYREALSGPSTEWITVCRAIADSYHAIGKHDAAINLLKAVVPHLKPSVEKASVYQELCRASFHAGKWKACEEYAQSGLSLLGETLPIGRAAVWTFFVRELCRHLSRAVIPGHRRMASDAASDIASRLIIRIIYTLVWSYVLNDSLKFAYAILRMLHIAEKRLGESIELGISQAAYAALCTVLQLPARALRYNNRALELRLKLNDPWGIAQSYQFFAYGYYFSGHIRKALEYYEKSLTLFKKIGDLKEYSNSLSGIIWCYILVADYTREKETIDEYARIAHKNNDRFAHCYACLFYGSYYMDIGEYALSEENLELARALSESNGFWGLHCMTLDHIGRLKNLTGDYAGAFESFTAAQAIDRSQNLLLESVSFLYANLADALIQTYVRDRSQRSDEQTSRLNQIRQACRTAWKKNKNSPINRGSAAGVMAQYYALTGNLKKAERFFQMSIQALEAIQFRVDLGRSIFKYGIFLSENGRQEMGRLKLEEAYLLFKNAGNGSYIKQAEALLGLTDNESPLPAAAFISQMKSKQLLAVITALIKDISANRGFEDILDRALGAVLEITGAGRGYVFAAHEQGAPVLLMAKKINADADDRISETIVHDTFDRSEAVLIASGEGPDGALLSGSPFPAAQSILSVPIRYDDQTIGVCYLDNPLTGDIFTADDRDSVQIIMEQISVLLYMRGLRRQVAELSDMEPTDAFCEQHAITPREKEIISLLSKGHTRKDICGMLDISYATVRFHLNNIVAKTGARSDVELVQLIKKDIER